MLPLAFIVGFPCEKPTQTFWSIPYKGKSPDPYNVFVFHFLVVLHDFFFLAFFIVVLTPITAVD